MRIAFRTCCGTPAEPAGRGGRFQRTAAFPRPLVILAVWWADLAEPSGSEPGVRRPVVVVQGGAFSRSRIGTVVCVAITSNLRWAEAPGNVLLSARITGLPKDSVANVSRLVTLDREALTKRVGSLPAKRLELVLLGIDIVLRR